MAGIAKREIRPSKIQIGVLVYPGCSAYVVAGILELFEIANVLAAGGNERSQNISFKVWTVSPLGRTVTATNAIRFRAVRSPGELDALIVPPVWHRSRSDLNTALHRLHPLLGRLRGFTKRCKLVTSACSGAVLLAEAGLLEGKKATTCWWLSEWFQKRYPSVRLMPDRLIVADGHTWTAAAGTAYVHLCLKIIDSTVGKPLSSMTAKFLLVEPNRETQAPFLSPLSANSEPDSLLASLESFVLNRIDRPIRLCELASAANMSIRSLFRYFDNAKGMTPLKFVQLLRMERGKQLLEKTSEPLEFIVPKCGYEDISSFRKLFRKRVGMTPKEYRQRFGGLARRAMRS